MIGVIERPTEWDLWPQVSELLERSIRRSGDTTIEEVSEHLESDKAALWVAVFGSVRFASAVQYLPTADGPQFYVWQAAGSFQYGRDVLGAAEAWARENGFSSMEFNGRVGWQRMLPDWQTVSVTMRKVLA